MCVGEGDEFFEGCDFGFCGRGRERFVALPAGGHGRVDADEDEEGAAEEFVENGLIVDVCCYPTGLPVLGDEVEEGVCGFECVGSGFGGAICGRG